MQQVNVNQSVQSIELNRGIDYCRSCVHENVDFDQFPCACCCCQIEDFVSDLFISRSYYEPYEL